MLITINTMFTSRSKQTPRFLHLSLLVKLILTDCNDIHLSIYLIQYRQNLNTTFNTASAIIKAMISLLILAPLAVTSLVQA